MKILIITLEITIAVDLKIQFMKWFCSAFWYFINTIYSVPPLMGESVNIIMCSMLKNL